MEEWGGRTIFVEVWGIRLLTFGIFVLLYLNGIFNGPYSI